jgi:hypothetical protein
MCKVPHYIFILPHNFESNVENMVLPTSEREAGIGGKRLRNLSEVLHIHTITLEGVMPGGGVPAKNLTYYSELQTKGILPGFVGSHARIGPCIALGERVNE